MFLLPSLLHHHDARVPGEVLVVGGRSRDDLGSDGGLRVPGGGIGLYCLWVPFRVTGPPRDREPVCAPRHAAGENGRGMLRKFHPYGSQKSTMARHHHGTVSAADDTARIQEPRAILEKLLRLLLLLPWGGGLRRLWPV